MREGEKSLYNFMIDLYSDMYDKPEFYCIPVREYDSYMNGRVREELLDKEKHKESRLRNKFQQSIQFYQKLIFEIGAKAELKADSNRLIVDGSILTDVLKIHRLSTLKGEQEGRARVLSKLGMEINQSNNAIEVSNDKYPKMIIALSALCKAKNGKYTLTNFLRCDFRSLMNSHKPDFDDVVSILPKCDKSKQSRLGKY